MTARNSPPKFMTGRMTVILLLVAALSTFSLLVLYAFAPELRSDNSAGADAASRSAIGFAGLQNLLSLSGTPVRVDHGLIPGVDQARPSLTIVTPDIATDGRDFVQYRADGPLLIILPKWQVVPMTLTPAWVMKDKVIDRVRVELLLRRRYPVSVTRDPSGKAPVRTMANLGAPVGMAEPVYPPIENIQTVFGGRALLTAIAHGPLVVQFRGGGDPVYVLADPDVMNNHALSDPATAQAALAIIAVLRRGAGPVLMDVTLNGLGRSPSFLRVLFDSTFLGATLCALLAAVLIGWHAAVHFGAPLPGGRVFALGKSALADSTASLIRMMGREGAMAQRYVVVVRETALGQLGARRAPEAEQNRLLAVIQSGGRVTISYDELAREAAMAANGADLLRIAKKAHAWRREITSGY